MELRHLRYFVAIAEERSFTRAAQRLWVAQPGLSTQIRRLEAELGVQLFDRHTRGVDLTEAGVLLLERARAALSAAEIAGATGRDLATGVAGSVRLGIATCAHWGQTLDLLERFTRERSGVEVTVLEGYGGMLWRDLRNGRLDALLAPAAFSSGDLRRIDLGAEAWVALVGTSHPLAGIGPLSADHLHHQRVAVTGHRDGAGYDRAIAEVLDDFGVTAELFPRTSGAGTARCRGGGGSDRFDHGTAEPPSGCRGPAIGSASNTVVQSHVARRDAVGCAQRVCAGRRGHRPAQPSHVASACRGRLIRRTR